MSYNAPDVYDQPEHFGLKQLHMLEEPNMSYEFNMFGIWLRESDGALFYASDRGCSCPSPFEDYASIEKLERLDSYATFEADLDAWLPKADNWTTPIPATEVAAVKHDIKRRLNAW